jgi:hypothetical protein
MGCAFGRTSSTRQPSSLALAGGGRARTAWPSEKQLGRFALSFLFVFRSRDLALWPGSELCLPRCAVK